MKITSLLVFAFVAIASPWISSSQAADPLYKVQPLRGFLQLPSDLPELGSCSAVAVNSKGELFLFHRGVHPILCFDATGKFLRSWGDGVIGIAHGLRIDRDDNVWCTDIGLHQVFKFDREGKLLLTLGTGKPGDGLDQFNKPTDIAFGSRGEFYISDGYGNSRVMKYSPNGAFIKTWGTLGVGKGEFTLPHSIIIDSQGRILVGDRENNRIQVFDEEGVYKEMWRGFAPYGLAYNPDGRLFVADGRANKILCLNEKGKIQQAIGRKGKAPGEFQMPHMLAFDADGNLFVGEVDGKRLQKLIFDPINKSKK